MKDSGVIIIIVFLSVELLLMNWNTNKYLMSDKDRIATEVYAETYQSDMITSLEATGIYRLLSDDYEGVTRVGRTFNIFPRKMFTTKKFLPTVYREVYGEFYKAKLSDSETILVLIGCNDIDAVENGTYKNLRAGYHEQAVSFGDEKYQNEASDKLKQLEADMSIKGYIDFGDTDWAKRHSFGLFAMCMLKAAIAVLMAAIAAWYIGIFRK